MTPTTEQQQQRQEEEHQQLEADVKNKFQSSVTMLR